MLYQLFNHVRTQNFLLQNIYFLNISSTLNAVQSVSERAAHGQQLGALHKGKVFHQEGDPRWREMSETYPSNKGREFELEKLTQVPLIVVAGDNDVDSANLSLREVKILAFIQPISLLEILC